MARNYIPRNDQDFKKGRVFLPPLAKPRLSKAWNLTPTAKVEQHNQQVGIVHDTIFIDVLVARRACARRAEREQHRQ